MFSSHSLSKKYKKTRAWLTQHGSSVQAWTGLICFILFVFFVFSDGDFSFLMTVSSLVSLFSFLMVALIIEKYKSVSGVSLRMMECYVVLYLARLFAIIPFEGYLPWDRTGDWLYQMSEASAFCLAGSIVYLCRYRYRATYNDSVDILNPYFLGVPCFLLALILHPTLNRFFIADVAWTFALYLESVACLAQLLMFQKEGKVQPFTTHFLAGQAFSKILSFLFWAKTYQELNSPGTRLLNKYVGLWVMLMQVLQLVLMGDFIYHYVRCLSKGISPQYILSESV